MATGLAANEGIRHDKHQTRHCRTRHRRIACRAVRGRSKKAPVKPDRYSTGVVAPSYGERRIAGAQPRAYGSIADRSVGTVTAPSIGTYNWPSVGVTNAVPTWSNTTR